MNLTTKQRMVFELTKLLIQQNTSQPVDKAVEYTEKILKSDKGQIGFIKDIKGK
jgi:rRNA processing protein Gar1